MKFFNSTKFIEIPDLDTNSQAFLKHGYYYKNIVPLCIVNLWTAIGR